LDSKINQLAADVRKSVDDRAQPSFAYAPLSGQPSGQPEGRGDSLSNQALKRLLEEREREVLLLRGREEELAKKEEHLERRMREYAAKKKELDALKRQAATSERAVAHETPTVEPLDVQDFPSRLVVDDKNGWLKDQSRIKMDLVEIRNEMGMKEDQMDYYPPQVSEDIIVKMESMEESLMDASREREEMSARLKKLEAHLEDAKNLLRVLDQLLGRLPPEIIDEFSKSKDFKLYEKILDEFRI